MADLDHFKSVNDTYGYEAGDVVLKRFAKLLTDNSRTSDICGCLGGEEFVIVLTHTDKKGVRIAIERIRGKFEAEKCSFDGKELCATASFGISGFQGRKAPKFDQIIRDADAALYTAKGGGRNRLDFASVRL